MSDEREHFKKVHGVTDEQTLDAIEELSAESAALREEVGRLREVLAMFDGSSDGVCPVCSYPVDECDNAIWTCKGRIVRRALASTSPAAPAVPGSACVKCWVCKECVGACDCTGGPTTDHECTCYIAPSDAC